MSRSIYAVLVVLSALAAFPAAAAGPYLVADLDTTPLAGGAFSPEIEWVELGGFLYFAADDGRHGLELWRTNGTLRGTRMVTDLCPGPCSSLPQELTAFKGRLAFNATDGFHGTEIWISDGTREGTLMPRDLCPGSCSAIFPGWSDPVVVGDRLFFVGRLPGHRLGVTDGTAEGTRWLMEPQPILLSPIGNLRGRLAFSGPGAQGFSALWLSDGTPEGTSPAVDLCAGAGQGPCAIDGPATVVGDRVVFSRGDQGSTGTWASDGTPQGTRQIGEARSALARILWKGALYFADFGGLWRSDGTLAGTVKLRTFPWTLGAISSSPRDFAALGDSLFFIAGDEPAGLAVWRTRGTPESTALVFDVTPGPASPDLGALTRVGDRLVFPVLSPGVTDLWETDGSAAGTRQAARLCGTGPIRCVGDLGPLSPTSLGKLYLFGLDEETTGTELWALDGGSVRRVRDIWRNPGSSRPETVAFDDTGAPIDAPDIASLDGRLLFSAKTTPQGPARLWASDGTAAGTAEISSEIPWPHGLVRIGDRLWLRGAREDVPAPYLYGRGIWSTDGTAAGTSGLAANVNVGSLPGGRPGLVLFAGMDPGLLEQIGSELWATNGAEDGTRLVKEIHTGIDPWFSPDGSGPGSSLPALFEPLGEGVIFAADDGLTGREPWITDGTDAGTRLLLDINPGVLIDGFPPHQGWSSPGPFVRFGARVLFAAHDGTRGRELWATDGTTAGTALARDLRPGAAGSDPRDLILVGSRLFFLADSGASDALWTVSSAGQITRVRLLAKGQRASSLAAAGGRLFFVVDDAATGPELWTSTGTRAGTRKVLDIRPGALGSYPQELTAVDGLLLFAADDGVHGLEPWVSDGTEAGTRLLADLAPGVAASGPRSFTVAGDLVAFDADDGVHGRELWAVRKADVRGDAFPAGGGGK